MCVGVEAGDDAPVDHPDAAVGAEQQVAGVHIAVKGAPAKGGQKEGLHHLLDDDRRVGAVAVDRRQVVHRHALDELHREHAPVGQLRVHLGHGHLGQVDQAEQAVEVDHGPGLVAQVELLAQLLTKPVELLEHRHGGLFAGGLDHLGEQRLQQVEVNGDPPLDVGSQHLDRHLGPVVSGCPVNDGDRGPADRVGVEVGVGVLQGATQFVLDEALHLVEGHRRSGVEAAAELVGHVVAENAGRRADQLAELEERCAQILERPAERRHPVVGAETPVAHAVGHDRPEAVGDHRAHRHRAAAPLGPGGVRLPSAEQVGRLKGHRIGGRQLVGGDGACGRPGRRRDDRVDHRSIGVAWACVIVRRGGIAEG